MKTTSPERQRTYRESRAAGIPIQAKGRTHSKTPEEKKLSQAAYSKKVRQALKTLVLSHYGNGWCICMVCGDNRIACLSIDHIVGGGLKHRESVPEIKRYGFYRWLEKNNFPEGYQTLCMSCQWVKRDKYNETRK